MPKFRDYHLHFPLLLFDHGREMRLLFVIRVFRDLIIKFSLFFLPIFLFQVGNDKLSSIFGQLGGVSGFQWGVFYVASYFLVLRLTVLFFSIPAAKLLQKMGIGRMMSFSHILYVLVFALFMVLPQFWWLLPIVAVVDGVQTMFFWTPYHVLLANTAHKKYMGRDLGMLQFGLQFVSMVAPAVAGAIIITLGYQFVFFLAVGFSLLAMLAALQLKNLSVSADLSVSDLISWLQQKDFRQLAISYAGRYLNDAIIVLWPLYVFILLGAVDKVGFLYSFSLLLAMLAALFIGSYVDHHKEKKWFFASGGVLSLVWLARSFVTSIWHIAVVDMMDRLSANFHWIFFDAQFLKGGKGRKILPYFVYREMILSVVGVVFWIVVVLLFLIAHSWKLLFLLGAVGVMMSLAVKDSIKSIK